MTIDVVYGEGWDAVRRVVIGQLSPEAAAARDAAGAQYAVILRGPGAGQPIVLHVAWAQHYLGAWEYDEQGRRVREADLRRIEPGRLFLNHTAQWRYESPDMAEFADDAGSVTMDLRPDGRGWTREQPKGDKGGLMQKGVELPLEQCWFPVPEFGDWAALSEAVDLSSVGGGPFRSGVLEEARDERAPLADPQPNWQPPRGARPKHLEAMFTEGSRFLLPSEYVSYGEPVPAAEREVVVRVRERGPLELPTGELVVRDPSWGGASADAYKPYTVTVRPGSYRVEIAQALSMSMSMSMYVVGVRLVISEQPAVSWELAVTRDQDARLLRDGQYYGFGVDAGIAALADASVVARLSARFVELFVRGPHAWGEGATEGGRVLADLATGANMVTFSSGMGDGSYPVWIGRDAEGEVTCFVADMQILCDAERCGD
ncbi:DUF4241 domain-containing protein [Streptomyces sp. NPDC050844]|uniref:DUF4241 domain-containing protein n=1 Tax=Streptomyces sp. NPDC050844 TaxID=3155790 RepID=UPI00340E230E